MLAWDADGVLLDSEKVAVETARDILLLVAPQVVGTLGDRFATCFSRRIQVEAVGEEAAPILRGMHRLIMRARAAKVRAFSEVLPIVTTTVVPQLVVTSAYEDTVRRGLGEHESAIVDVRGRSCGNKASILRSCGEVADWVYVTDSPRDIATCRECGVGVVVAVTWGYYDSEALTAAEPDRLVSSATDLRRVLVELGTHR